MCSGRFSEEDSSRAACCGRVNAKCSGQIAKGPKGAGKRHFLMFLSLISFFPSF